MFDCVGDWFHVRTFHFLLGCLLGCLLGAVGGNNRGFFVYCSADILIMNCFHTTNVWGCVEYMLVITHSRLGLDEFVILMMFLAKIDQ